MESSKLGNKPDRVWEEAVMRWLNEATHKATREKDKAHLRWLDPHLRGLSLAAIRRDTADRLTQVRLAEGVSNATVNRMLEVLRAILRRAAREWEWTDHTPYICLLPEPRRRIRWLTREEADLLVAELPEHLAAMVRFSLSTGLRQRNVVALQWAQVDLKRRIAWIHPDQAKAGKGIAVPLNADAIVVLRGQQGKHSSFVFTYHGRPVKQVNGGAWKRALARAEIEDFRWHDLRHTWASWHVQAGTPLNVLQELGGWESVSMVRRYAHLAADHLAAYAETLARPRMVQRAGTKLAHLK